MAFLSPDELAAENLAVLGRVFLFARAELRRMSLRAFAEEINEFWGLRVVNIQGLSTTERGSLLRGKLTVSLQTLSFGAPFTYWPSRGRAFTLQELIAVARGELEPVLSVAPVSQIDAFGRWIVRDGVTPEEQIAMVGERGISPKRWAEIKRGGKMLAHEVIALHDLVDLSEDSFLMLCGHSPRMGQHWEPPDNEPPPLPLEWSPPVFSSDNLT